MNGVRFWQFGSSGIYKGSHYSKFIFNGAAPQHIAQSPEMNLVGYSNLKGFPVQGRKITNAYTIVDFYDGYPDFPASKNNAIIKDMAANIVIFYKEPNKPFNVQINSVLLNGMHINDFEIDYKEHHTYSTPSRLYKIIFLKNQNMHLKQLLKKQVYITINLTVHYDNI